MLVSEELNDYPILNAVSYCILSILSQEADSAPSDMWRHRSVHPTHTETQIQNRSAHFRIWYRIWVVQRLV